jgi:serine/threonine-protein kinase
LVQDLRRSHLVDRARLDPVVDAFLQKNPRAGAPALADHLVGQGLLTPFQAKRLLAGSVELVLGPYALVDELGAGNAGTVYRAVSRKDQGLYAVKALPRRSVWDVEKARQVVREFEPCRHPGMIAFTDVGTSGRFHYLAWPLAPGEPLDKLVRRQGPLHPAQAARCALQAAEALDACHQRGLVHGRVKASNLLLGEDQQVRVLDLGIAMVLAGTDMLDTGSSAKLAGDLDCASPESILDPASQSPASDRYSLGCVLYFLLTGRYPFSEGSNRTKILAHRTQSPPPLREFRPDVSAALDAVVETLMQKTPEARFDDTAAAIRALRPLASGAPAVQFQKEAGQDPAADRKASPPAVASPPGGAAAGEEQPPSRGLPGSFRSLGWASVLLLVLLSAAVLGLAVVAVRELLH